MEAQELLESKNSEIFFNDDTIKCGPDTHWKILIQPKYQNKTLRLGLSLQTWPQQVDKIEVFTQLAWTDVHVSKACLFTFDHIGQEKYVEIIPFSLFQQYHVKALESSKLIEFRAIISILQFHHKDSVLYRHSPPLNIIDNRVFAWKWDINSHDISLFQKCTSSIVFSDDYMRHNMFGVSLVPNDRHEETSNVTIIIYCGAMPPKVLEMECMVTLRCEVHSKVYCSQCTSIFAVSQGKYMNYYIIDEAFTFDEFKSIQQLVLQIDVKVIQIKLHSSPSWINIEHKRLVDPTIDYEFDMIPTEHFDEKQGQSGEYSYYLNHNDAWIRNLSQECLEYAATRNKFSGDRMITDSIFIIGERDNIDKFSIHRKYDAGGNPMEWCKHISLQEELEWGLRQCSHIQRGDICASDPPKKKRKLNN